MSILHNANGYIFEIKKNPISIQRLNFNGVNTPLYGVKETYQNSFNRATNITSVSLVCGVQMTQRLCVPSFFNPSLGLVSLDKAFQSDATKYQDLEKFGRSHKAVYSVNPMLICSFNGKFDISTGLWIPDKTRFEYYLQMNIGKENINGEMKDVVYCSLLTPSNNNGMMRGSEVASLINSLNANLPAQMTDSLSSKEDFWLSRLK